MEITRSTRAELARLAALLMAQDPRSIPVFIGAEPTSPNVGDLWIPSVGFPALRGPSGWIYLGRKGDRGDDGENGTDGVDARQIELEATATDLRWRREGEDWIELVSFDTLKGDPGDRGDDGDDGADAPLLELQRTVDEIQWRVETGSWAPLIAISDLKGEPGPPGDDGNDGADALQVELDRTDTSIRWRRVGGTWADLALLTDLQGPPGEPGTPADPGEPGTPGREVELRTTSAEIQWRRNGDTSWVVLIPLENLRGLPGNPGTNAAELELQKTSTEIQWRRVGAASWTTLVALSAIAGTNGKEVELQKTATAIQWRLAGGTWADLILLSVLTGPQGPSGAVLVGTTTITYTALVSLSLAARDLVGTLAGAVPGGRYVAFCDTYRLASSGAFTNGRPDGYTIGDCYCVTAGQVRIGVVYPALAIGATFTMNVSVFRIG